MKSVFLPPREFSDGRGGRLDDVEHGAVVAEVDDRNAVSVSLQAGQMLVFSGLLLHASGPNHGGPTRYVYQFSTAVPGARRPERCLPIRRGGAPVD